MRHVTLREVCSRVDYGFTASAVTDGGGPKFLRITDIDKSYIDWNEVPRCSASSDEVKKYALESGDVVVARTGASTGRSQWVQIGEPTVFASYLVRFRAGPEINSRYLVYILSARSWRNFVSSRAHGKSAQPNMSASAMADFEFSLPPISVQESIAETLGALDDKIAANDRALRLCVELCDAKFTRAVQNIQPGERTFGDMAEVGGGGTPNTSVDDYWNGDISWATPTDVTALAGPYLFSTGRTISPAGLSSCASALYPKGSILMTSRATIGAFAIAQLPVAVNQGFIVVNARDSRYQHWLFHEMRARTSEFLSHANGVTFLELGRGKFKQFSVRVPRAEVAHQFSQEVGAIHAVAAQMIVESRKVAEVRDELLPLLMSGKIHVRDAEKVVEEAV